MPFFFCLLAMARISNTVLNRSGKSEHPYLVSHLIFFFFVSHLIKANFSSSSLSMISAMALSHMTFIMLSYIPSKANLLSIFLINQNWILSNASYAYIEMIIWFLPFILLIWCTTLIDSWILNHPWIHPWNKPCLIMVYDPFNILLN